MLPPLLRTNVLLLAGLLLSAPAGFAQEATSSGYGLETALPRALLVEDRTGTVILDKNEHERFAPASLVKLMTMEIVFGAIRSGEISLTTEFPVSEHAWRTGGAPSGSSTMFAALKSTIPVADLIRGTIVQGANDGAIILAEGLSGSEEAFTQRMNERARELGLADTVYANPTGLQDEGEEQHTSARDLVTLTRALRSGYPELFAIYAEPAFEWNGIFQRNRNPILGEALGGEGVGTGFSEDSGYSLMGVADKNGRTFLMALSGAETSAARSAEAERLLSFGFDDLIEANVLDAGSIVGHVPVFNGIVETIPVRIDEAIRILLPEDKLGEVEAEVRFEGPLVAPVEKGAEVGVLDVRLAGQTIYSQTVYADAAAGIGSFTERAGGALEELAFGWTRSF